MPTNGKLNVPLQFVLAILIAVVSVVGSHYVTKGNMEVELQKQKDHDLHLEWQLNHHIQESKEDFVEIKQLIRDIDLKLDEL